MLIYVHPNRRRRGILSDVGNVFMGQVGYIFGTDY